MTAPFLVNARLLRLACVDTKGLVPPCTYLSCQTLKCTLTSGCMTVPGSVCKVNYIKMMLLGSVKTAHVIVHDVKIITLIKCILNIFCYYEIINTINTHINTHTANVKTVRV